MTGRPDEQPAVGTELTPARLLEALHVSAGGPVAGASVGDLTGAPSVAMLTPPRAAALLAAWTGARLHAGLVGLVAASDADLALLLGDWCFAHALQSLAQAGDVTAIGHLSAAIGDCAALLGATPVDAAALGHIWDQTGEALCAR